MTTVVDVDILPAKNDKGRNTVGIGRQLERGLCVAEKSTGSGKMTRLLGSLSTTLSWKNEFAYCY